MDAETQAYQEASAAIKFKQNLAQGLGGATVFGIIAAAGHALFGSAMNATAATTAIASTTTPAAAALTTAAVLPWLGIAAFVAMGVGCLYLASNYFAESVRLDQNHQAKQIAHGMQGVVPVIEQKPTTFPAQAATLPTLDTPADTAPENATLIPSKPATVVQQVAHAGRAAANDMLPERVPA